jgi:hypothetical protein
MLLVNRAANENHWLGIRLIGSESNRDAIGAMVTVKGADSGTPRSWIDQVRSGSSYDSNNDLRLHFGLGQQSKITSIEVRWPNGREELFAGTPADQIITLKEGSGQAKK